MGFFLNYTFDLIDGRRAFSDEPGDLPFFINIHARQRRSQQTRQLKGKGIGQVQLRVSLEAVNKNGILRADGINAPAVWLPSNP